MVSLINRTIRSNTGFIEVLGILSNKGYYKKEGYNNILSGFKGYGEKGYKWSYLNWIEIRLFD